MSNDTRKKINDDAKRIRAIVYSKLRMPVLLYFAKLGAHEAPTQILRLMMILQSTFLVTSASNIKSAKTSLQNLFNMIDADPLFNKTEDGQ